MRSAETSGRRRLLTLLGVLALLGPVVLMGTRLWTTTGADVDVAAAERDGVTYLRPLVQLVAVTADAQSAAVAGRPVDGGRLRDAAAQLGQVDAVVGQRLQTTRRFTEISARVAQLGSASPTGAAAFTAYSQLTDLELALVRAVADVSNLILDPDLDSYYVMDTTVLRVPSIVVTAGRLTDRAVLAESGGTGARAGTALLVATARAQVQSDAAAVDEGLRKALASTRSRSLGPGLLPQLDRLRSAVSAFAPPTADIGVEPGDRTATQDAAARGPVRDAALALEAGALDQLDLLLAARQSAGLGQRSLVFGLVGAGAAVALTCWWLSGPRRRGRLDEHDDDEDDDGPGVEEPEQSPELVEARELLESRRLVRVGRAVSAQREKR